jgi:lipopolysaccharide export system permease protein
MDGSNGMSVAATADQGKFLSTDDPNVILFRLEHGRLIQDSPKFATPRTLAFNTYDLPVSLPVIDQFRRRGGTVSDELYLHELWQAGYAGKAPDEHQKLEAQATFNFRLVEVLMILMLPLLAVSLAVPPKRSSSALGIFLSILIVVAYHKVNQYAQNAATNGQVNAVVALWLPLVILSVLIGWMYHVLAHKPGGQPIGALEWFFAKTAKRLRALLPKVREA